jgi:putative colanic acid biosynthesis glycosyltransferase
VTVNLNNSTGLAATRTSLVGQTFWSGTAEWVVIDGGSTDDSETIVRGADLSDVSWYSSPDSGIYDAMNRGIRAVRGRHTIFLNAGDSLAGPLVIERLTRTLAQDDREGEIVWMGDWSIVLPTGAVIPRTSRSVNYLWHSLPTSHQALIYPTRYLGRSGYDTSYKITGDYQLTAHLHRSGIQFRRLGYPVASFVVGGTSFRRPIQHLREAARVQQEVLELPRLWIGASLCLRVAALARLRFQARFRKG